MMAAKKKKPAPKPAPKQDRGEPKSKKPEIPKELVDKFLEDKITPKDKKKISKIKCTNLWHDRYRINVWLEETQEEFFSSSYRIGYSYFLHYDDGKIIDKTIYPKPIEDKIF
jgi:hypothetical protein